MVNDTTLYQVYIIRCPRGVDPSAAPYLLKGSGRADYQVYKDAQTLLGALEWELASIAPQQTRRSLRGIGEGLRDFVKRSSRR